MIILCVVATLHIKVILSPADPKMFEKLLVDSSARPLAEKYKAFKSSSVL